VTVEAERYMAAVEALEGVPDMVRAAMNTPDATYAEWSALYLASMETY
jgi:hypothetical protein